jgi:hypothetical protein
MTSNRLLWSAPVLFLLPAPRVLYPDNSPSQSPPSVQIRTDVSPREITIGDVIHYQIAVTYSKRVEPVPLTLPKPWGEFTLLNYIPSPPESFTGDSLTLTHELFLTTFSTGTQTIPELNLAFKTPAGKLAQAKTPEVKITVRSLLQEKGDLGGLRPLKGLFNFKSYWWAWLLLFLCLTAGLLYGGFKWMKLKKNPQGDISKPKRPPEETAWEALHKLEDSDMLANGQIKEFYYRLSVITRRYLEHRYQFSALDRTTTELLNEFRRSNLSYALTNLCRAFFDNADLVKFAKFTPREEEIESDMERVKQFITLTTPAKKEESPMDKIPV